MAVAMAESLGERIARLRKAAGLTQKDLADRAGLTLGNIRSIEQEQTTDPRWDTMRALARALGVTLDELAGE